MTSWLRVGGDVRAREHAGELELVRGDLVVLGLGGNAHRPQLVVELAHEGRDLLLDGAEVVVFHLLALGGHGAEDRAAGEDEVGALLIQLAIDEEVLLLGADGRRDARRVLDAEGVQNAESLLVERLDGAEERHLLVERVAEVGDEGRRDAQRGAGGRVLRKAGLVTSQAV